MKAGRREILELLESYRSLPALWNVNCAEYSNRSIKHKQYKILLKCYRKHFPEAQLADLKKKINMLRTNFRKELRKKHKLGDNVDFKSSLFYFNAISFLEDIVTSRGSNPALKDEDIILKFKSRKRKPPDEQILLEADPLEESEDINNHQLANEWAEQLSYMDPTQQIFAVKVISDVFLNGQLGLLTPNTTLTETPKQEPLNKCQFVQAFNYFMHNDEEFADKLYDAYLQSEYKFIPTPTTYIK